MGLVHLQLRLCTVEVQLVINSNMTLLEINYCNSIIMLLGVCVCVYASACR